MTRPPDQPSIPSLPSRSLLEHQSNHLAGIRARLLRGVHIARRRSVLDLGAGYGAVTPELVRRSGGRVVAIDLHRSALAADPTPFQGAGRICCNAMRLPFADGCFDLVFCQFALMWMDAAPVIAEVFRVLEPAGTLIAIEPDYGGMIEFPESIRTRDIWQDALGRAGADPFIGRKLPSLLSAAGFDVRVEQVSEVGPADENRFHLLRGLPLTAEERQQLDAIEQSDRELMGPWDRVVHLPLFLVTAAKP